MARKPAEPKITLSVDYQKAITAFMKTGKETGDLRKALEALNKEVSKRAPISQADKAFNRFERTINKLASEIKGNGATTQLNQMAHALEKVGGVSKLTEVQVENLTRKLQRLAAAGGVVPKELQGLVGRTGGGAGAAIESLVNDAAMAQSGPLSGIGATLAAIGPQGAAVAGALGAVSTALATATALATKFAQTGAAVDDAAQRLGMSAQAVQELSYAADMSATSLGTITGSIEKLQKEIIDSPDKFEALGLSVQSLLAMEPEQQFYAVADAIQRLESPTLQAHAALEIFGKTGGELLPLIRSGMGDLAAEAHRVGAVMDEQMVAAAAQLDDATLALTKSWDALLVSMGGTIGQSPLVIQGLKDIAALVGQITAATNSGGPGLLERMLGAGFTKDLLLLRSLVGRQGEWDFANYKTKGTADQVAFLKSETARQQGGADEPADLFSITGSDDSFKEWLARQDEQVRARHEAATRAAEAALKAGKTVQEAEQRAAAAISAHRAALASQEEKDLKAWADQERAAILAATAVMVAELGDMDSSGMSKSLSESLDKTIIEIQNGVADLYNETAPVFAAMLGISEEAYRAMTGGHVDIPEAERDLRSWSDALADIAHQLQGFGGAGESLGRILLGASGMGSALDALKKGMTIGEGAGAKTSFGNLFKGGFTDVAKNLTGALQAGMAAFDVAKTLVSMFKKTEAQKVMKDVGRDYGVSISEGLAEQIAKDSKRLGDRVAATLKNLGAIIAEAGGVEKFGVDKSISKLRDLFSAIERGQLSVQEAGETFDEVFGQLIPHAIDKATGIARADFLELIELQKRFGLQSKEVEGYLRQQSETGLKGLKLFLENAQVTVPGAALAIGAALAQALDDGLRSGRPMHEVLEELQPLIDEFAADLEAAGLSGGAAFEAMQAKARLFADEVAGPALKGVAGLTSFMVASFNQGLLTQEAFAGLAAQVTDTRQKLIDEGHSSSEVNAAMQQDLQKIWELRKRTGYEVDENTAKMLAEAEAAGTVGEQYMSAADRMAESMDGVRVAIEAIARGLGFLPAAAESAANGMNAAFDGVSGPRTGPTYVPGGPRPDYSGWEMPPLPGASEGAAAEFARAGQLIVAHGPEVVLPADKDSRILGDLAERLAGLMGGGGGDSAAIVEGLQRLELAMQAVAERPVTVQSFLDGEKVAEDQAKRLERGTPAGRRLGRATRMEARS